MTLFTALSLGKMEPMQFIYRDSFSIKYPIKVDMPLNKEKNHASCLDGCLVLRHIKPFHLSPMVREAWVQSQVVPYQRLVLHSSLLNTQQYKVRIKGKME